MNHFPNKNESGVQVLGVNLVEGEPWSRPGSRQLMTVLVWVKPADPHGRLSTARVPLEIRVEGAAQPMVCEASGIVANASGHVYAHVALPPGKIWIHVRGRPTPRWGFRVERSGKPPAALCGHGRRTPSRMATRLFMDGHRTALCGVQEVYFYPCCRVNFSHWREFQNYDLNVVSPVSGSVRFAVGSKEWTVKQGEYLVVNPRQAGGPCDRQGWPVNYRKIVIYQSALREAREALGLSQSMGPFDFAEGPRAISPEVGAALTAWEGLFHSEETFGLNEVARTASRGLVFALLREHPNQLRHQRTGGAHRGDYDPRLKSVLLYMEAHYMEPLENARLAREAGIGLRWLQRMFQSGLGLTPKDYLQDLRVSKAKELLKDPRAKVEDVARAVGYRNPRAFYRVFKARAHVPPKLLRR